MTELEDIMHQRRRKYITSLPLKISQARGWLSEIESQQGNGQALKSINKFFELNDVSELARIGEDTCIKWMQPANGHKLFEQADIDSLHGKLDRLERAADAAAKIHLTAAVEGASLPSTRSKRVDDPVEVLLLTEDKKLRVEWMAEFDKERAKILPVGSVAFARSLIESQAPDAIVIGVPVGEEMPYEQVTHVVASLPNGANCAIIVTTQQGNTSERARALRAGAKAFLENETAKVVARQTMEWVRKQRSTEPFKILSVEDDPEFAETIKTVLETAGFIVDCISDPEQFDSALRACEPDLLLLDVMLGDISGHDLAMYARQHDRYAELPILFLSSKNDTSDHIDSMRAGGDDHLVKGVPVPYIVSAITSRLERKTVRSGKRDTKTGFLTFGTLMDRLAAVLHQRKESPSLFLLRFNIDGIRHINQRCGYEFGDRIVAALARAIEDAFGRSELAGRIGGDELAVVVDGLAPEEVTRLAQSVLEAFASQQHACKGKSLQATARAGIVRFEPQLFSAEIWLSCAQEACRGAKEKGGNCIFQGGK